MFGGQRAFLIFARLPPWNIYRKSNPIKTNLTETVKAGVRGWQGAMSEPDRFFSRRLNVLLPTKVGRHRSEILYRPRLCFLFRRLPNFDLIETFIPLYLCKLNDISRKPSSELSSFFVKCVLMKYQRKQTFCC